MPRIFFPDPHFVVTSESKENQKQKREEQDCEQCKECEKITADPVFSGRVVKCTECERFFVFPIPGKITTMYYL